MLVCRGAQSAAVDRVLQYPSRFACPASPPHLQLLRERGELDTRFGQATLGILLLQDIATVPFLVLLPLIEGNNAGGLRVGSEAQLRCGSRMAAAVDGMPGTLGW